MFSITTEHIGKTFDKGQIKALDDINIAVNKAELYGIIGPDGAGKTTLFRILTTLWLASSGEARVEGLDVVKDYAAIRKLIGYMPGKFSLYQDLTVEENLEFFASLFNTSIQKNYALVKDIYVQLEPFKKRRAGKLSGGMKQKLALCCALIHRPKVLFLDEPTTGVDPVSRKEFWEMLKRLQQQEITILVSTPYMDEANLCDRIGLIQGGKILSIDTPANIIQNYDRKLFAVRSDNMFQLITDLRRNEKVNSCFGFGESLHVTMKEQQHAKTDLEQYIHSLNYQQVLVEQIVPGIEDCFMELGHVHN